MKEDSKNYRKQEKVLEDKVSSMQKEAGEKINIIKELNEKLSSLIKKRCRQKG